MIIFISLQSSTRKKFVKIYTFVFLEVLHGASYFLLFQLAILHVRLCTLAKATSHQTRHQVVQLAAGNLYSPLSMLVSELKM